MYKLYSDPITGNTSGVIRSSDEARIPFAPANTDYQVFKEEVRSGAAQLQDADGVVMSPPEAQAFIKTLP